MERNYVKMAVEELTQKQKMFCEEYIFDWNGSRAYKIAYPNSKDSTARTNASKLLTKTNILAYIEEIQKDLQRLAGISRLSVLKDLQKIQDEAEQARDKIKAIEVKNKMLGFNAPEQTENKNTHDFKGIDPINWLDE